MRSAGEETRVSTYEIDADGIVRAWSQAAARLFGYQAREAIGRSARDLLPEAPVTPVTAMQSTALRADGERLVVALTISPGTNGTLGCRVWEVAQHRDAAVLLSDLSARRFATDAVLTADRAGNVIEINPAAERLLGCTSASALGRPLGEVLGDDTLPRRVLDGDVVHHERRRGDQHTMVSALPLRDAYGGIVGATAILSDVTAERGAAAAREREERDARLLERAAQGLVESLDLQVTLERTVAAFVPDLADLCVVYSLEEGPMLRLHAAATTDPELRPGAERLKDSSDRPLDARLERELISGARPYVHGRMSAEDLRKTVSNIPEGELAARLGDAWRTALPLRARGGIWGIVVLLSRGKRPAPDRADLRLLAQISERAGQALQNARAYATAAESRARFTAAFDNAPIGMALVSPDGEVTDANPALAEITGRSREQLVGAPLPELYHPDEHDIGAAERRFLRADGQTVWVQVRVARLDEDHSRDVVLQVLDITDRKRYEGQLQYLADHDALTGLYNRRRFAEELDWVLAYSRRYRSPAAVIAIDVDNFKFVNDTYGHATGDALLVAIAEALRARCRESDIVGRVGGDEFGVILPQSGREEADVVAQSLLEAVRDRVQVMVGTRAVRTTASIGVRLVGHDTKLTAEEILSDADIALYDAKESGRDRLSVAGDGSAVTDRLRARIGWSDRIRDALVEERFELYEQPILHIASGRVESSELLLRMRPPGGGELIAPGEFLESAERFGQIQAIDRWVLSQAIALLAERQAAGLDHELEVNLSGGSISDPSVIDFIVAEVRNAPIDPTRLTIEVTETTAIVNIDRARALAQSLADLGCRFALDDFGSGFGSFYYLKHLPFDVVKIDGEFIRELETSHADRLTVQAIVQIARGLGKPTVAEFVETAATLREVTRLGVDYAQGYHLGHPRPVALDPGFSP